MLLDGVAQLVIAETQRLGRLALIPAVLAKCMLENSAFVRVEVLPGKRRVLNAARRIGEEQPRRVDLGFDFADLPVRARKLDLRFVSI